MRLISILAIALALALTGCRSGPGSDCDTCATTEAAASAPSGNAAAAAATGGQRANNAPFVEDTVSPRAHTTIARGAGAATSTSADTEHRAVSSGGAQNLALMNPAVAQANAGGKSASVAAAERVVNALLVKLQLDSAKGLPVEDTLAALTAAQERLASAEAGSRANITHNYNMGGDHTIVGYSRAGNGEGPDSPEATKVLGDAAQAAFRAKESKASSRDLGSAPADAPDAPPSEGN